MSDQSPVGRTALRRLIEAAKVPSTPDPRVEAVAHVICRMGGHLPNIDNEAPGACDHHRRQAVVALELAKQPADALAEAQQVAAHLAHNIRRVYDDPETPRDLRPGLIVARVICEQFGKGPEPRPERATDQVVADILGLVCVTVTEDQVASWAEEDREAALEWASLTHLAASDNPVEVPERPAFLDEYAR